MELIIEQLGTTNNVIERQRLAKRQISIGRSYESDVIMSDQHIDPHHASLEFEDDQWWLSDDQSMNGVRKKGDREAGTRWLVSSGDVFFMGRNKIRVLFADHPVAETVRINKTEEFLLWLGQWPVLLFTFLSYLTVSLFRVHLTAQSNTEWPEVITQRIVEVLPFIALAAAVYLLSVLFKRSGHFLSHLGVLAFIGILGSALTLLVKIVKFNTSSDLSMLVGALDLFAEYGLIFLYFWCVLYLAFHLTMKWRVGLSSLVVGALLLFGLLADKSNLFFDSQIDTDWSVMSPGFLWRSPSTQASFVGETRHLFISTEKARAKMIREKEEKREGN